MAEQSKIETELAAEIEKLNAFAAVSTDACLIAQVIALSDAEVRKLFIAKLKASYTFVSAFCLAGPSIPEQSRVVFNFECPPGKLCLVRPSFLVVVNTIERRVVQTVDPYVATEYSATSRETAQAANAVGGAMPFTLAVASNAPNVSVDQPGMAPYLAREATFFAALPPATGPGRTPPPIPHPPPPPRPPPTRCSWGSESFCASASVTQCPHYDDSSNDYAADDTVADSATDD